MRMTEITSCGACGSALFEGAGMCYECGVVLSTQCRFTLEVIHSTGRVERAASPGDAITVGRSADNDVVLSDPRISRHHLRFRFRTDGAWVEELGATNPSSVSGRPISTGTVFAPGSRLELAGATITLARHTTVCATGSTTSR